MDLKIEKAVLHNIKTLLNQVVSTNNHVRSVQDNPELSDADKTATTNFANYHVMVLSVLLHDFRDIVLEMFPDENAKAILAWTENNYSLNVASGAIKVCECPECKVELIDGDDRSEVR